MLDPPAHTATDMDIGMAENMTGSLQQEDAPGVPRFVRPFS